VGDYGQDKAEEIAKAIVTGRNRTSHEWAELEQPG